MTKHFLSRWRLTALMLVTAMLCVGALVPQTAYAGTTGNITGTVTDPNGAPLADVQVSASSASQSATATSDAHGFYSLVNLIPDTYTVSFQKSGYAATSIPGVVVMQDQTQRVNQQLHTELRTIASVHAAGASNLVKPNEGSDVYTVSGQQLTAATNPVNALQTIYEWMAVTPGVTANGFPAQPRVRGGQVTDLGYEFEGIPINDRMVGFFTSNLSNTGLSNVEVYTGGLAGAGAVNGTGYFNSVLKTGTYPGFSTLGYQASSPEQNQYVSFERGWASPNHRFSYYVGFTGVNSANQYDYGEHTYPQVLFPFCYCDGPGPVRERNWVANVHFHPDTKNDFQVVATNDLGEFDFNYLLSRSPGEPLPLAISPCPGATSSWSGGQFPLAGGPGTGTYATGGTAPNGQPCPLGIYWSALANGAGNMWHHYGGLGKIQWNHDFNDHSFLNLRLAVNYNQYIFDQPMADPNIPSLENPGAPFSWASNILGTTCPLYPYTAGTPVAAPAGDPFDMCASGDGIQVFWGNRRSNIWQLAGDYTNAINEHLTLKAGVSDEMDKNTFDYLNTHVFTVVPNGTPSGGLLYPGVDETADYPTNEQVAYFDPEIHVGKFMLNPGITYAQRHYGFPADQGYATGAGVCPTGETCNVYSGGYTGRVLNPTFNGTYAFGADDDLKFSYGNTSSFISSVYIYTSSVAAYTGFDGVSTTRNPFLPGTSFAPQINHAAQLLWEHNFGDNTTMRVGPYYNKTTNYYNNYKPFLGYFISTSGSPCNPLNVGGCTPCTAGATNCVPIFAKNSVLTNNNQHQTMGVEFALNHVDNRPRGWSWWASATYDNFWTNARDISGAFINSPLPANITQLIRATSNPLWSGTILGDYHSGGFHFDPLLYYQADTFFNTGQTNTGYPNYTPCATNGLPYICQNEQIGHGWWKAKLTAYKELGPKQNFIVGLTVDNLFDNVTDTTPCTSDGTGCWPFNGPQSGIVDTPGSLIYQNYSQTPRTFYFFAGVKM